MPKLKNKVPSYRLHKATGQAVVTLNGRDIYLGAHNSAESREAYQAALNEWLASHRQRPSSGLRERDATPADGLTINEIFLAHWEFVQEHCRKYGKRKRTHVFRIVLSHSRKAYSEAVYRQTRHEPSRLGEGQEAEEQEQGLVRQLCHHLGRR